MNPGRVLLHLGLPKTATSSLQHNVFQKLHEEGKVNFLGKCLDQDYRTGDIEVFNYTGKFIRQSAEGHLEISEARDLLARVINLDRLNVFSDEGLMIAYPGKKNLSLLEKIANLNSIFEGYDVSVAVTLRDPVDYLYSLYVQLYPDFFSNLSSLNSIQKYIEKLLSNPDDVLFESFFYKRWLNALEERFDVSTFEYDDLLVRDSNLYQRWASMLGISGDDFRKYFEVRQVNVKSKSGKEVEKVRTLKGLKDGLKKMLVVDSVFYKIIKSLYKLCRLDKIFSYRFPSKATHRYPGPELRDRLYHLWH